MIPNTGLIRPLALPLSAPLHSMLVVPRYKKPGEDKPQRDLELHRTIELSNTLEIYTND